MAPRVRAASTLRGLLPWLLAAGLIGLLLWQVPFEAMGRALHGARLGVFLPGAAVASLVWFALDSATLAQLFSRAFTPLGWAEARALRGLSYLATPIHWHAGKAAIVARLRRTKGLPILDATSGCCSSRRSTRSSRRCSRPAAPGCSRRARALAPLRGVGIALSAASLGFPIAVRSDRPALLVLDRWWRSAVHRAHRLRAPRPRPALRPQDRLPRLRGRLPRRPARLRCRRPPPARSPRRPSCRWSGACPHPRRPRYAAGGHAPSLRWCRPRVDVGAGDPRLRLRVSIVLMGMRCAIGVCYLGRLRGAPEHGERAEGRGGAVHTRVGAVER
ncbi:MAG: hypothetical protein R3E53_06270 [Myxococcota bacterium]